MKKIILFLSAALMFNSSALANATSQTKCFLIVENNKIIKQEGQDDDCKARHAPCSTFKIAISLMGYNEKILLDETHPELPFKKGYADFLDVWKQNQNPTSWIKNSCVWYSQVTTQKLGMSKFKEYVKKFNYGNQDISGDKGKNNGLSRAWLSSSLQISPQEQVFFLQKLVDKKLPVSLHAQEMTKNILFVEDLPNGWKFYGKTGAGNLLNEKGEQKPDQQIGWFVGWIEKGDRNIVFAHYVEDNQQDSGSGKRAKIAAKAKMVEFIKNTISN